MAKLAGVPCSVIEQAGNKLCELEQHVINPQQINNLSPQQHHLEFNHTPIEHPAITQLKKLNPNALTPIEALNWLTEIKKGI